MRYKIIGGIERRRANDSKPLACRIKEGMRPGDVAFGAFLDHETCTLDGIKCCLMLEMAFVDIAIDRVWPLVILLRRVVQEDISIALLGFFVSDDEVSGGSDFAT